VGEASFARRLFRARAYNRPRFGDHAQATAFTLAHSTNTPGGVMITRYLRGGEVRTGTFEDVE